VEPREPVKNELTHGDVVMWSLGVTLATFVAAQQVLALVPAAAHDLVLLVGAQLPVYLGGCALYAARRPGKSFAELFALRRAPAALLVVGFLLGLAVHAPAERLNTAIMHAFPMKRDASEELLSRLMPHGPAHAVVLALFVALLGPFSEELLYRGALYTGLRGTASAPSAAITTGLLFTLVHMEPRAWLPIFMLAGCLGYLRAVSGSLLPGVLLHAAFNAMTLALSWSDPGGEAFWLGPRVVIGSSLAAVLLLLLAARLAHKSQLVERARALDGIPAHGDGAATP
jgi:membrane protease YdiL (CAAX protease family)